MLVADIEGIHNEAVKEITAAKDVSALEALRVKYLGRKGEITGILRSLKDLPVKDRRILGPQAQELKREVAVLIESKVKEFAAGNVSGAETADLTAPGRPASRGHLHPLTLVEEEMTHIFRSMNFSVVDGPEIETEHYAFNALNIPAMHPARDAWSTFWIKERGRRPRNASGGAQDTQGNGLLLRPHMSPVQIRYMESHKPPFQMVAPGRVFRYEATDASHEINFYQLEGLVVGKHITLANFKFVVEAFFKRFFSAGGRASGKQSKIEFRYRPSYFPFVEPGLEVDVRIIKDKKQAAKDGNSVQSKWLEIMGAGMVHPRVFEYAHYNPRDWRGFAFGMGIDRLAMIKYNIPDIRMFYSGDVRFVRQFS